MRQRQLGRIGLRDFHDWTGHVGHRWLHVGWTGRRGECAGDSRGPRPRRELDRHGADLRVGALGSGGRPRPARAAGGAASARLHEVRPRAGQRQRRAVRVARRVCSRVRGEPATARRRSDRSVSAALARRSADRGNRGGVRRTAEGRQDPGDRRLELQRRPARRVAGDSGVPLHTLQAPYSILRPAAVEGAAAVVRESHGGRHRVLAAAARHVVRHVGPRQDVPGR